MTNLNFEPHFPLNMIPKINLGLFESTFQFNEVKYNSIQNNANNIYFFNSIEKTSVFIRKKVKPTTKSQLSSNPTQTKR